MKNIVRFVLVFNFLFMLPFVLHAFERWPDTGQMISYTDQFGEDSDYNNLPQSYTKLGHGGIELQDTTTVFDGWVMTRDNVTGLIWEVKQDKDNVTNYNNPNDADNTYTWCDRSDGSGTCGDNTDTADYINILNAINFGGFNDWRMPMIGELSGIVNNDKFDPVINTAFFPNTQSALYWSDTTSSPHSVSDRAWNVHFRLGETTGYSATNNKGHSIYVRAVRGPKTNGPTFIDNEDGTATDTSTGLMWQKQKSHAGFINWDTAIDYCENLSFAGYDDWRMPNRNELQSLVADYSTTPVVDRVFYPVWDFEEWTSTTVPLGTNGAWSVDPFFGIVKTMGKFQLGQVRAVRGGRAEVFEDLTEECSFFPWYPENESIPSTVMTGGRAVRWYRILKTDNTPVSRKRLYYRFRGSERVYDSVTDQNGFIRIITTGVTSDTKFELIVTDNIGEDLDFPVQNLSEFSVIVETRKFSERHKVLFGIGLEKGFGGPGFELGPVELKTAEASIYGGVNISTVISLDTTGSQTDLTVENRIGEELGLNASAGLFGDAWKDKTSPQVNIGPEFNGEISEAKAVYYDFPDFYNQDNETYNQQLFVSAVAFFENMVAANPNHHIMLDRLLYMLIQQVSDVDQYESGIGHTFSMGGGGSVGLTATIANPLEPKSRNESSGGSVEVKTSLIDGDYVFEKDVQQGFDGRFASTQKIIYNIDLLTFHAGFNQTHDQATEGILFPSFEFDIAAFNPDIKLLEGEQRIEFTVLPDQNKSFKYRCLTDREGGNAALFGLNTPVQEDYLEYIADTENVLDEISRKSDTIRNILNNGSVHFNPKVYTQIQNAMRNIDTRVVRCENIKKETNLVSIPFDISLSLGLKLGLNLKLDILSELEYQANRGIVLPNAGSPILLEIYKKDNFITDYVRGINSVLEEYANALSVPIKEFLDTIGIVVEAGTAIVVETAKNIGETAATIKGEADQFVTGTTVYLSSINPFRKTYRISAIKTVSRNVLSDNDEFLASTLGHVYIINVKDNHDQPVSQFSNPLELSIEYYDAMLIEAGFQVNDRTKLKIFRWNGQTGYYDLIGGDINTNARTITANIDMPGQYVLAIDESPPVARDFKLSNRTATPKLSFLLSDTLSGIDPDTVLLTIDNVEWIDKDNYENHFDITSGLFTCDITQALINGEHHVHFSVGDFVGNTDAFDFQFSTNDIKPEIIHTPVTQADTESGLHIHASIINDTGISNVFIYYKPAQIDSAFTILPMIYSQDAAAYTGTVPSEYVTDLGISYQIKAFDMSGNETCTPVYDVSITDTAGPRISGTPFLIRENNNIILKWNPAVDIDTKGYKVFIGENSFSLNLYADVEYSNWLKFSPEGGRAYVSVLGYDQQGNEGGLTTQVFFQTYLDLKGDINFDSQISQKDVRLGIQLLSTVPSEATVYTKTDVNMDGVIGPENIIYDLQILSNIREMP
ncbi:DUF1566 domain-containing protein [Desulfobacula sp.]|uniref:Lcl C-terminal domain-containing protein n=1 Tax=Desulfobacula sp. TaxID=2593537 RepID=UPI002615F0EE|nr:DUF1566 domain-containing protein [Desulfobacula sp.]